MNSSLVTKLVSFFTVFILLLSSLPLVTPVVAADSYPIGTGDTEVASALDYLRGQQGADGSINDFATSAWVTMAIAAAGEDPDNWKVGGNPSVVDYLAANAGSAATTSDCERMLLAIAAAGEDPTNFGGVDLLSTLKAAYDGTQIGDVSWLSDDFWGVLALIAAGESTTSAIVTSTVAHILSHQNADGGWGWAVGATSDVDDTAAAIMALIVAGESAGSAAVNNALTYIKSTQIDNGGFESWGSTNSGTDAWGILGIVAAGQNPTGAGWKSGASYDPVDDLLGFQNADGSFNWLTDTPSNKELMTAYAIPALLGVPYPVAVLTPSTDGSVLVRIEGGNDTIWTGTVTVSDSTIIDDLGGQHYLAQPTALGALDEASQSGGFPYVVQDTAYGLYIYSINGEEPADVDGWLYRMDYQSPWVGAADFILDETEPPSPPHQEILFSYGSWGELPLKLEVDNTEPGLGEPFTVTVMQYSDDTQTWSPCDSATVHADQDYTTGPAGTVAITPIASTTIVVFAEKEGFIRSNRVTVTVGEGSAEPGSEQEVGVDAMILPAISFSVSPDDIYFGMLGPRDVSEPQTVTLTNEGAWNIQITCTVSDEADNLYVDGIRLDDEDWNQFSTVIERDDLAHSAVTLVVPEDYTLTGHQDGTIIFWATEASQT